MSEQTLSQILTSVQSRQHEMSYRSWIDPEALAEAQATLGNVRQRLNMIIPISQP
jgi:inorganic triphosphatase YgiF